MVREQFVLKTAMEYDLDYLALSPAYNYLTEDVSDILQRVYRFVDIFLVSFGDKSLEDILTTYNFSLICEKNEQKNHEKAYRRALTRVVNGIKEVIIYYGSVEELTEVSLKYQLGISEDQIYLLHLAHEVFHVFEYEEGLEIASNINPRIKQGRILKRNLKQELSEIACYYFSMKYAKTTIHPRALEYALLANRQMMKEIEEV
ncbi:MAG: hypothetical protein ACRC6X_05010 [Culicoidibacterales bacterium]